MLLLRFVDDIVSIGMANVTRAVGAIDYSVVFDGVVVVVVVIVAVALALSLALVVSLSVLWF